MRVIAGKYKGRALRTVAGLDVRPTSDRLRETLFNILMNRIAGARFLDICAGSGAVSIEALSRNAIHAILIESSRAAIQVIKENIKHCNIEASQYTLLGSDALLALKQLSKYGSVCDIVYFDPPYSSDIYLPVLSYLGESSLLAADSLVIVEHHKKLELPFEIGNLVVYRNLKQGETHLSFYQYK